MVSKSFKTSIFSVSLLFKSMRSISRDVMSSGILLCINKINYKELFIIFSPYVARDCSEWGDPHDIEHVRNIDRHVLSVFNAALTVALIKLRHGITEKLISMAYLT